MNDAPCAALATGVIADGVYIFPMRVYYDDTDAVGIVYHANYLKYAERARTEFLRHIGIDHIAILAEDDAAFAVRHMAIDYLKPARLDERLEVHTRLTEVKGASVRATQTVRRRGDDLVRMDLRLACMNTAGKPIRLPVTVRQSLETLCTSNQLD